MLLFVNLYLCCCLQLEFSLWKIFTICIYLKSFLYNFLLYKSIYTNFPSSRNHKQKKIAHSTNKHCSFVQLTTTKCCSFDVEHTRSVKCLNLEGCKRCFFLTVLCVLNYLIFMLCAALPTRIRHFTIIVMLKSLGSTSLSFHCRRQRYNTVAANQPLTATTKQFVLGNLQAHNQCN